jgi:DNA-binding transcriptional LysR family regulator
MTGAAKALGKSQPVVTRLIQDLETDIGFTLLHRNGPRIAPTEQAVDFFAQAELFLGGLRTISERAREISTSHARPIEIASIPAIAASFVPLALSRLPEHLFPHHVHLQSTASENVVQAVVARTADIGIASLPLDNSGIDVHWIAEVPCVALVASNDALAAKTLLEPQDLEGRRLIASANPYRLRLRINQALEKIGIKPAAVIDSNATYVSVSLARAGLGVAIVESATIHGLPVDGLSVIPLSFHIPFHWGVITASGRPLPRTIETFIRELEAVASADIPGFKKYESIAAAML